MLKRHNGDMRFCTVAIDVLQRPVLPFLRIVKVPLAMSSITFPQTGNTIFPPFKKSMLHNLL